MAREGCGVSFVNPPLLLPPVLSGLFNTRFNTSCSSSPVMAEEVCAIILTREIPDLKTAGMLKTSL